MANMLEDGQIMDPMTPALAPAAVAPPAALPAAGRSSTNGLEQIFNISIDGMDQARFKAPRNFKSWITSSINGTSNSCTSSSNGTSNGSGSARSNPEPT